MAKYEGHRQLVRKDDLFRPSTKKIVLRPATCKNCKQTEYVNANKGFKGVKFVCIECVDKYSDFKQETKEIRSLVQHFTFPSKLITNATRVGAEKMINLGIEKARKKTGIPNLTIEQLEAVIVKKNPYI